MHKKNPQPPFNLFSLIGRQNVQYALVIVPSEKNYGIVALLYSMFRLYT